MVNSEVQVEKLLIFNVLKTTNKRFSVLLDVNLFPVITREIISDVQSELSVAEGGEGESGFVLLALSVFLLSGRVFLY